MCFFIWFGSFVFCFLLSNFPWEFFLLWPMDYLEVCGLVCQYLEIFLLSVFNFYFDSIVVRAHIPYDFYSFHFLEVCFITQDIFCVCFVGSWKEYVLCCCGVERLLNVSCVTLVGECFHRVQVLCWQFSTQNSNDTNVRSFLIISQVPELLFIFFQSISPMLFKQGLFYFFLSSVDVFYFSFLPIALAKTSNAWAVKK